MTAVGLHKTEVSGVRQDNGIVTREILDAAFVVLPRITEDKAGLIKLKSE